MKKKSVVSLVLDGMAALFLFGGGVALYGRTMIAWYIPVCVSFIVTAIALWLAWDRWRIIPGCHSRLINRLSIAVAVGAVSYFGFLGLNYCVADEASVKEVTVTVTRKYTEQRTRYRRLRRGRMVPDGKYNTYHVSVSIPGGGVKNMEIPLGRYNRVKVGSHTSFCMRTGLFGYPVITDTGNL